MITSKIARGASLPNAALPCCTCVCTNPTCALYYPSSRQFATSSRLGPRLTSSPTASTSLPPRLPRRVLQSLTQRDRVLGVTKTGERLPYRETEWGRRLERKGRIARKIQIEDSRKQAIYQASDEKRETSLVSCCCAQPVSNQIIGSTTSYFAERTFAAQRATAGLPPLTQETLMSIYESIMAPPMMLSSSKLLEKPSTAALPSPRPDILSELEARVAQHRIASATASHTGVESDVDQNAREHDEQVSTDPNPSTSSQVSSSDPSVRDIIRDPSGLAEWFADVVSVRPPSPVVVQPPPSQVIRGEFELTQVLDTLEALVSDVENDYAGFTQQQVDRPPILMPSVPSAPLDPVESSRTATRATELATAEEWEALGLEATRKGKVDDAVRVLKLMRVRT